MVCAKDLSHALRRGMSAIFVFQPERVVPDCKEDAIASHQGVCGAVETTASPASLEQQGGVCDKHGVVLLVLRKLHLGKSTTFPGVSHH